MSGRIKEGGGMSIKTMDRVREFKDRTRQAAIRTKETAQNHFQEAENETAYASDRITETSKAAAQDAVRELDRKRKDAQEKTKEEIKKKIRERAENKEIKTDTPEKADKTGTAGSRSAEPGSQKAGSGKPAAETGSRSIRGTEHSLKTSSHSVKTAEQSANAGIKTTRQGMRTAAKSTEAAAKAGEKAAVEAGKKTAAAAQKGAAATGKAAEGTAKTAATAVKAAAAALKEGIAAIGAALAAVAPIIILVCIFLAVVVLLTGDTRQSDAEFDNVSAIRDLNAAWQEQVDLIKDECNCDEVQMEGGRATWPEIFCLYAAKTSRQSVGDFDAKEELSRIFWDMNHLSYKVEVKIQGAAPEKEKTEVIKKVKVRTDYVAAGYVKREEKTTFSRFDTSSRESLIKSPRLPEEWKNKDLTFILTIRASHKSVDEMAELYGFTDDQKEQTKLLLSDEFDAYWLERLYGTGGSNKEIINVALSQLGNSGGWPYWEYCGWPSRVEWCACFVTWCGEQCGYIDKGLLPMTSSPWVQTEFFKDRNQWSDGSITPVTGMVIFFDWSGNGLPDHVGFVEYVENGTVHTVEGNSGDAVEQNSYPVGDSCIMGYGTIGKTK